MATRLEQLRAALQATDLPGLVVNNPDNIYYLSGFTGSAGMLLVTASAQLLISDFRYTLQAAAEAPEWTFVLARESVIAMVCQVMADDGLHHVGFEPDAVTVTQFDALTADDADHSLTFVPAPNIVETLRLVKDAEEVARIRAAVRVTDAAYAHLLTLVRPGVTELELALAAEWYMRTHGASAVAFEIIIAAGPHSALPHAQPRPVALQPGDLVVVDMGARCQGYCADMTRTFAVEYAGATAREIYRICREAQLAGLAQIHAGMSGRDADAVVRQVITDAGYGEAFGHGTGHGVGIAVHDAPRLSRYTEDVLPTGAAVTVEPGIYLADVGGVRIEDLVLVTDTGVEILTATPKPEELPIIC